MNSVQADGDGRSVRRQRNRQAVIDAFISLMSEVSGDPTFGQVAHRADISTRSVYRYFEDAGSLRKAAFEHVMTMIGPLFPSEMWPTMEDVAFAERVEEFIAERSRLHSRIGEVARSAQAIALYEERIAEELGHARRRLRARIERLFAPELQRFNEAEQELRVTAIDQTAQLTSRDYVVRARGRSADEYEQFLRWQIFSALDGD